MSRSKSSSAHTSPRFELSHSRAFLKIWTQASWTGKQGSKSPSQSLVVISRLNVLHSRERRQTGHTHTPLVSESLPVRLVHMRGRADLAVSYGCQFWL